MDDAALARLLTPEGWALLSSLPPYSDADALTLGERLRSKGVDPELAAAALTQSRLRAHAAAKFGEFALGMLFTPEGLEQATRLPVAAHHARRFRDAGLTRVADLGCGIGGDAMTMAALGLGVVAVEVDETTAALATVNLRHFPEAEVRHGDALATDLADVDGAWADPARRRAGRRVFDPAAYSPPLDAVLALRDRLPLGVKVAPGIPYAALPEDVHAQWTSVDGDVVEAALWSGPLAPEGPGRSALLLRGSSAHVLHDPAGPPASSPAPAAPVVELGEYLYEPDGAVVRAGLVAHLAERLSAGILSDSIAYLTSHRHSATPYATGYRVLDHFDFSLKRLRTYLHERDVGVLTIKKRGTAVEPERLRQRLGLRGGARATVVLTRLRGRLSVVLVEPLGAPADG